MGETRRRQKDRWCFPTKKYGKPPLASSGQPIPAWERDFCTAECSIPWKKLCEAKKFMHLYDNVVNWDDSEGREAFENAKSRYYARIHGLPCNIPLPDSNMYIDMVDHDSLADPELVEDLCKQPPISEDEEETRSTCTWDSFLFAHQPVPVSGWGDEEEDIGNIVATGWGDVEDRILPSNTTSDWDVIPTGWGNLENPVSSNKIMGGQKADALAHSSGIAWKRNSDGCCNDSMQQKPWQNWEDRRSYVRGRSRRGRGDSRYANTHGRKN